MYEYGMGLSREERIAKNVRDMLELNQGTVPYDRARGVSPRWEHKQSGRYTAAMLSEAQDMVNSRETRATVTLTATETGFRCRLEVDPDD